MHSLAYGTALVLAVAIIAIGTQFLVSPRAATRNFGLPLPEDGPNVAAWLRLKGVRDVISGLIVLALLAWVGPRAAGIVLLVQAFTAIGDMLVVLTGNGSTKSAFGIHGLTAAVIILAAIPLIMGGR